MFARLKQNALREYAHQKAERQDVMAAGDPDSPQARRLARRIGGGGVFIGLVAAIVNVCTYRFAGSLWIPAVAVLLVGWTLGPWMLITGRLPRRMRERM